MGEKNPGIILVYTFSKKNAAVSMHCIKGHEICLSLRQNLESLKICRRRKYLSVLTWSKAESSQVGKMQPPWSGACWGGGIQVQVSGLCCEGLPERPRSSGFDLCLQRDRSDAAGAFAAPGCGASWARAGRCLRCVGQVKRFSTEPKKSGTYGGWLIGKCWGHGVCLKSL